MAWHSHIERWPRGAPKLGRTPAKFSVVTPGSVLLRGVTPDSTLVVIGAHDFGKDANDPIYKLVRDVSLSNVLLVDSLVGIAGVAS